MKIRFFLWKRFKVHFQLYRNFLLTKSGPLGSYSSRVEFSSLRFIELADGAEYHASPVVKKPQTCSLAYCFVSRKRLTLIALLRERCIRKKAPKSKNHHYALRWLMLRSYNPFDVEYLCFRFDVEDLHFEVVFFCGNKLKVLRLFKIFFYNL